MTTTNDAPAPAPSGSGVRVKPLEWSLGRATADDDDGGHFGCWAGGWYQIRREGRGKWTAGTHETWAPGKKASGQWRNLGVFSSKNEAKAAAQADYEARILSALASDASPRGEGPWVAYTQAGAFVAHITSKENFQRMQAAGFDLRCVTAHPAPATVEMREALQAAEPFVELLHSLTGEKRARAIVWKALKQIRAALAPATELDSPTTNGQK